MGLVAIPARGRSGLGLGIIAGLSLNANLWFHYVWSFALGWTLLAAGIVAFVLRLPAWQHLILDRLHTLSGPGPSAGEEPAHEPD